MLDIDLILILNSDVVLRNVGEKYWALNTKDGNQFKLNDVSFFILNAFREPKSISVMLELVIKEYKIDLEKLKEDCNTILQYAIEKEIVKEVLP